MSTFRQAESLKRALARLIELGIPSAELTVFASSEIEPDFAEMLSEVAGKEGELLVLLRGSRNEEWTSLFRGPAGQNTEARARLARQFEKWLSPRFSGDLLAHIRSGACVLAVPAAPEMEPRLTEILLELSALRVQLHDTDPT